MIPSLSTHLALLLSAGHAALAANCYGSGNPGLSVSDYQEAAAGICNGGSSINYSFGNTGYPNYNPLQIEASYSGSEKAHCWDAFNNIISQCVQNEGRNGGEWDYNYNGDNEKYVLQGIEG
ncbi:hypothetical protein BJX63DRAFT_427193 [Aspergillus granulosus]|uniref:Uncharacterized protein n=1 Tax=Aspergillus granulosus TaxID=176169 RepID=A0ABR4I4E8_9EURO